jgi:hypothetical protein
MHAVCVEAQEKMANQLAKTSFAQLAQSDATMEKRNSTQTGLAPTSIQWR